MSNRLIFALLAAALLSWGCDGKLQLSPSDRDGFASPVPGDETELPPDQHEPPPGTVVRPPDEEVDEEVCQFIDPGATPLRRLTVEEYHNSVRDLFPSATIPDQTFTPDERVSSFRANTISAVTELQAEEYQRAAENIAEIVIADLESVLGADPDEATVRTFIESHGQRAFRRPLEQAEVDDLYALYESGRTEFDAETGARMVVEAILQSPVFLYRLELGEEGAEQVVHLTDFEVASRLSYFMWGTLPDEELLQAAENGELSSKSDIEAQARRMLEHPKARMRVNDVITQWLQIDELDRVDKQDEAFTDAMRDSMVAETEAFIDHVIWEADGGIEELLTADYTFVDANTASLYGVEATADDGMVRVDLPEGRQGILSHPGVLAAYGHGQMPVHRGRFVRDTFLCMGTPEPPNVIEPLETFEGESMRSKAEKRMNATDEGCAGCHSMMDGIGLTFDNFDSLGRYQTEDEFGNRLEGTGEIIATRHTDGVVDGVGELAQTLAASPEVQSCVTKQFFTYAFARLDGNNDACSLHMIDQALAESGTVREMLIAITTTDAFRYRRNMSLDM